MNLTTSEQIDRYSTTAIRYAVVLAFLAASTGCSLTVDATPPPVIHYQLDYPAPAPSEARLPYVLRLLPVQTSSVYDRNQIVIREGDHRVDSYFYHRWTTHPAQMIGDLIERDLAESGLFEAVIRATVPLRSDFTLATSLERAEEDQSGECTARLRIRFTLSKQTKGAANPILFQKAYEAAEPCRAGEVQGVVAAMSLAMARISDQLKAKLIDELSPPGTPGGSGN